MPSLAIQFSNALTVQARVIGAIMLRDMRTRFGRTHIGYIIAVIWPLAHAGFILLGFTLANRVAPIGGDPVIFVSTGIVPYIMCFYPSRMMTFSIEHNKALLLFPIVRVYDIILARAILEFLTASLVFVIFSTIVALAFNVDIRPISYVDALFGVLASVYFGVCMGFVSTLLMSLAKIWNALQIIIMLFMYMSAGVLFSPSLVSADVQEWLWYNPLLHCVEWLRSAYFEGYANDFLSKPYVLGVSTLLLFIGLAGERFIRGKIMTS
ncbi:MAG: hypothetical protein CFE31_19370 [Rhizobiales bacterium PAR1]|nr:MAG: hypothetical protein CFE31_19370 [Rhizobiales bacterium PAR1]